MYRLYYSPGACSLAAHIVLEEIGAPYELVLVSSAGESEGEMTSTDRWRAINPKGRIPVLCPVPGRAGGEDMVLTELSAILIYLGQSHPEAALLPGNPAGTARCIEWMNWLASNVHAMSYGQIWRPNRFVDRSDLIPELRASGFSNVRAQYSYIEALLSDGREWAIPSGYTVVDPYLLVFYVWGMRVGLPMDGYPAWSRLMRRICERRAVKHALSVENIPPDL